MVAVQLVATGASAVVTPSILGQALGGLPGGPVGMLALGGLLIWGGSQTQGLMKGIVVGAGAGLATAAAFQFIGPVQVSA